MPSRSKRVTMRQIADEAGVSIGAVSAVINNAKGSIGVGPATRKRIQAAVKRLGYQVNAQARSLRLGRTHLIGAALDDITVPFLAELIRYTGRELQKSGYGLMLFDMPATTNESASLIDICSQNRVDALLLAGSTRQLSDPDILKLHDRHLPVVLLERNPPSSRIRSIQVDNIQGGTLAVQFLTTTEQRKRLAFITGPAENTMSQDRLEGARQGLPPQAKEIALVVGDWSIESGYQAAKSILSNKKIKRIDAIFAFNDMMAIGAMRAIREANLQIGDEIAIIGFDDIPQASFTSPPLSSIRQPVQAMGAAAASLLLDAVGHTKDSQASRHLVFAPELAIRNQ